MDSEKKHLAYTSPDGKEIDIIIDKSTVWLNQAQIADLFDMGRSDVSKQINKLSAKERADDSVCAKMEYTASDSKTYSTQYYNLDVILYIGYKRIFSIAKHFHQFCDLQLKKYQSPKEIKNAYHWFERVLKATTHYCEEFLLLSDGSRSVDAIKEYMKLINKLRNECDDEDELIRIRDKKAKEAISDDIRGYLKHHGKEPIFQPNHLMCRLAVLRDDVHKINYEFLIEYDIFDPVTEIYYGVKAVSDELESDDEFIKEAEERWNAIKVELKDLYRNREYKYRYKETDNGNNGTFWPFWIRYDIGNEKLSEVVDQYLEPLFESYKEYIPNLIEVENNFSVIKDKINKNLKNNVDVFAEIDKKLQDDLGEKSMIEFHDIVLRKLIEMGLICKRKKDEKYTLTGNLKDLSTYMACTYAELRIRRRNEGINLDDVNVPIKLWSKVIVNGNGSRTNIKGWGNRFAPNESRYIEIEDIVKRWFPSD